MVASRLLRIRIIFAALLLVATAMTQQVIVSSRQPAIADSAIQDSAIQDSPTSHSTSPGSITLDSSNSESQKSDASGLVFHQSVRRVVVDVVVSDSNGNSVSGLAPTDFSISEDGKPQRIRSFDVHDFDALSDSLPKLPPSLPINTFVNVPSGPERGPLYVLLLDLLDMGIDDQPRAREQLLKFIRSKPMGTRFAIFVLSDGLYLAQAFTEDRNRLADVLDPKNPRSHIPRIFMYADNYQPFFSAPRALIQIAKFLADLPGHKNVIWLSASFPSSILPSSDPGTEALNSEDLIKEATNSMARGQIAVYPVDVRGVVATNVMSRPQGGAMSTTTDGTALNASYMTEEEIAHATGGRAFYSTNDVATALKDATETGGRYYTLTYSPSNQNYNGHLRHIGVEISKQGYHLAYRRSYYGNPSYGGPGSFAAKGNTAAELEPLAVSRAADSLFPNMQHGAPLAHQLLFRAHIYALGPPAKATAQQMANLADQPAFFRERRKNKPIKPLRAVPLQTYEIDYTAAARYPALEVAAAAFDADGKMLNGEIHRTAQESAVVSAGERRAGIYRIQQQFDVPTTAVSIRLAVRDVATDNVGALEVNLPLAPEGQTTRAAILPASGSQAPPKPR